MNRNKSICITILCLSLAMVRSLPIDAQKVTFHDGFISLKHIRQMEITYLLYRRKRMIPRKTEKEYRV